MTTLGPSPGGTIIEEQGLKVDDGAASPDSGLAPRTRQAAAAGRAVLTAFARRQGSDSGCLRRGWREGLPYRCRPIRSGVFCRLVAKELPVQVAGDPERPIELAIMSRDISPYLFYLVIHL